MAPSLAPLLELPGVRDAVDQARAAVDQALRHPALRRSGGAVAAELGLRSAVASAALEGHRYPLDEVRSGTVTDPVVQGALRASAALDQLSLRWRSAPRQVLARLHVLAATGCPGVGPDDLGRPLAAPEVAARLDLLTDVIAAGPDEVPAVIRAAVVHGELLAVRPFPGPSGVVARAAARLTLIADGMDPRGLLAPEVAHLALEPEYVGTVNAFTAGTPDGVRSWLRHCAAAVTEAAQELTRVADAANVLTGRSGRA
ncbi:MAG TPA: oxidoreductase [Micromonosporaceae bacterium]